MIANFSRNIDHVVSYSIRLILTKLSQIYLNNLTTDEKENRVYLLLSLMFIKWRCLLSILAAVVISSRVSDLE